MASALSLISIGLLSGCGGGGAGDGDADTDTDVDADSDTDADSDVDTDSDSNSDVPIDCPPYPSEGLGWQEGDIATDFALPGNGEDGEWSLADFWCMAHEGTPRATVAVLYVDHWSDGFRAQGAPQVQTWQDEYAPRGLVPVGVSLGEPEEAARSFWESLGHTHPWVADEAYLTMQFFPVGEKTPGYPFHVVIDLQTMEIAHVKLGLLDVEPLFEPYLRPEEP